MPDRFRTKLVYADKIQRNVAATYDGYVWRLNSAYDPDYTGAGHQPLGYDQLAPALYARYRVLSCKVEVEVVNTGSSAPLNWVCYPSNAHALASGSVATAWERAAQWGCPVHTAQQVASGGGPRFVKTFYPHQVPGLTKAEYLSDDSFQAAYNADPAEVIDLQVEVSSADASSLCVYAIAIRLTYEVEFSDRVQLSGS